MVLDAPPELWELVDRRRVEGFLGRAGTPSRKDEVQTWHLATVAWALASRFGTEGRAATASRPVHVEPGRPESTAVVHHRPGEVLAAAWRRATRRSSRRQPSGGEVRRIGALAVQERPQRLVGRDDRRREHRRAVRGHEQRATAADLMDHDHPGTVGQIPTFS